MILKTGKTLWYGNKVLHSIDLIEIKKREMIGAKNSKKEFYLMAHGMALLPLQSHWHAHPKAAYPQTDCTAHTATTL